MQQVNASEFAKERLLRKPRLKSVQLSRKAASLRTPGREDSPLGSYDSAFDSDTIFSYFNEEIKKEEEKDEEKEEKKEEEEEDDVGGWQRKRSKRVTTVLDAPINNNTRVEIGFRRKVDQTDIPYQFQVISEQSEAVVLHLEFNSSDVDKLCEIIIDKLKLEYCPKLEYFQEVTSEYLPFESMNDLPKQCKIRVCRPSLQDVTSYDLISLLRKNVRVKDKRLRLKTIPNCFLAPEAVDWVIREKIKGIETRSEAASFLNRLLNEKYITQVSGDQSKVFLDKPNVYYQIPVFNEDEILEDVSSNLESVYIWGAGVCEPKLLDLRARICQVACGAVHTLALCAETGTVFAWGEGQSGQLGLGADQTISPKPQIVTALAQEPVVLIAAGRAQSACSIAMKNGEGSIYYNWGWSGKNAPQFEPKMFQHPLFNSLEILQIGLGCYHTSILAQEPKGYQNTHVVVWGNNKYGQLGLGDFESQQITTPTIIKHLEDKEIISVAVGDYHNLALSANGEVFAWGINADGELGIGNFENQYIPTKISLRSVKDISCGGKHSVAITSSGNVFSWGCGVGGRLGHGTDSSAFIPKLISDLNGVTKISCGHSHTLASTDQEQLYVWGDGNLGKLGLGHCKDVKQPSIIRIPNKLIVQLCCGGHTSTVLVIDDLLEIVARATEKKYGETYSEYRKLLTIMLEQQGETLQKLARKTRSELAGKKLQKVSIAKSVSSMFKKKALTSASLEHVYAISLSKYRLDFGLAGKKSPVFKYLTDQIVIVNNISRAFFTISRPMVDNSTNYSLLITPSSGYADKNFNKRNSGKGVDKTTPNFCRQILYYSLETETFVRCKEINYNDIKEGEVLGSGASGTVSKVNFNGTDVAVKQFRIFGLNKEDCDVFRTEILIASNLDHPNIIKCVGVCTNFPHLCLVLEYFPLGDLRRILNQKSSLSVNLLIKIALDVAQGIHYLHERKIIHRDLKPDNIMIESLELSGKVNAKVTDFGASKVLRSNKELSTDVGTVRYMPPEVLSRSKNSNEKIDVYSFGIVLWEIFSEGKLPFSDIHFSWQLAEAVVQGDRPAIPKDWFVPKNIVKLMQDCWHQLPRSRPTFNDIIYTLMDHLLAENVMVTEMVPNDSAFSYKPEASEIENLHKAATQNNEELQAHKKRKQELKEQLALLQQELQAEEDSIKRCKSIQQSIKLQIVQASDTRKKIQSLRKLTLTDNFKL